MFLSNIYNFLCVSYYRLLYRQTYTGTSVHFLICGSMITHIHPLSSVFWIFQVSSETYCDILLHCGIKCSYVPFPLSAIVAVSCMFSWAAKHELWHFIFRCTAVTMIERFVAAKQLKAMLRGIYSVQDD